MRYHIEYQDRDGKTQTGRIHIERLPFETPAQTRSRAISAAAFKFVARRKFIRAVAIPETAIERELRLDEERIADEMTAAEVRGITAPEF